MVPTVAEVKSRLLSLPFEALLSGLCSLHPLEPTPHSQWAAHTQPQRALHKDSVPFPHFGAPGPTFRWPSVSLALLFGVLVIAQSSAGPGTECSVGVTGGMPAQAYPVPSPLQRLCSPGWVRCCLRAAAPLRVSPWASADRPALF